MAKVQILPKRSAVKAGDTWDLSPLYTSDQKWEKDFLNWSGRVAGYARFKGKLGESARTLAACLRFDRDMDRLSERLGNYASLKTTEDEGNSTYQRMKGRYQHVATKSAEAASYLRPEILAIPAATMKKFLADKALAEWALVLERILRYRPHTLSKKEENLLAMQGQMSDASGQIFRQLHDADLKWGQVKDHKGTLIELGHSTLPLLLRSPARKVRQESFHKYYEQFSAHQNAFAASLHGSVQRDVYYARARNYPSALEGALFHDNVPTSVYDNLIASVHRALPALHRFYDVRRRKMKLRDIHHYDTYVPILSDIEKKHTWEQAARAVVQALEPLGDEYCRNLHEGLTSARWCDRYPNAGKRSGAFSSGGYEGPPYILMNYQPQVLDKVFTLAHEAGHSMHTWYSARNQPFQYYGYTIFVAEVASTFNEQLLLHRLMEKAKDDREKAYLVNHAIDEIRGTIFRQTMFAEFEKIIHATVEAGEPLTIEALRGIYRKLLEQYFGPDFAIDKELELECLRIPHFYHAFYVYKYATGLSAAVALSQRVLKGGAKELGDYLGFLKGGCSKWPLDLLRGAGVDLEKPGPVDAALGHFDELVRQLDELI